MRRSNLKSCYLFIPCTMDSHETLMIPLQKLGHRCIWRRCGRSQPNESVQTLGKENADTESHSASAACSMMAVFMCLFSLFTDVAEKRRQRRCSQMPKSSALWPLLDLRLLSVHPHLLCSLHPSVWICLSPPLVLLEHSAHILFLERLRRCRGAPLWRRAKE